MTTTFKRMTGLLLCALAAGSAMSLTPARAAAPSGPGEYEIRGSAVVARTTRTAFEGSLCAAQVADSAVNGVDGAIVDVSSMAGPGEAAGLAWSAGIPVGAGWSEITLLSASCTRVSSVNATGSTATVALPASVKWLVFSPAVGADVTLTLTDA